MTEIMRSAWKDLGLASPKEAAGGHAYGVFWLPSSQDPKTQTRSYGRTGHYDPVANRSNYHLLLRHQVTEVIWGSPPSGSPNLEAHGVKIRSLSGNSSTTQLLADQEVILAAGAIHSPGILQRSGIGPADILKEAKIDVKVELPGVGQNFQDHATGNLFFNCKYIHILFKLAQYRLTDQSPMMSSQTRSQCS